MTPLAEEIFLNLQHVPAVFLRWFLKPKVSGRSQPLLIWEVVKLLIGTAQHKLPQQDIDTSL